MSRIKIDATTWKESETVDETTFEVVIGDDKQPNFEPQAKVQVQFPGGEPNEVNFSARLVDWRPANQKTIVEDTDKIRSVVGSEYESRYYGKGGEFEFDLVINKPAPSNVFEWTLQTKNLKAYYQPPLTQDEIDFGAFRDDPRIDGSYAFYHSTKRNHAKGGTNYRNGKAFHLYRPIVTDANRKTTWADLWISPDLDRMTVTVDPGWLRNAAYPIVIDPDIGYTTAGLSSQTMVATFWLLDIDDSGVAGTADTIKAYIAESASEGTDPNIKAAFFKESDGVLQEVSSTIKTLSSSTFAWETFTLAGTTSIAASTGYIIACTGDIGRGVHRYDGGSDNDGGYDGGASYSSPGNISLPIAVHNRQCSFYLSYTEEASDVTITVPAKTFTFTKTAPSVSAGASVIVPAKTFTFTKTAPSVSAGASVIVPAKTFTFTKTAPSVSAGASVIVPAKTFTFTKTTPSVSAGASVIVPAKTFTFTKTAPTVSAGGAVTISVPAKTFTFTKTAPAVSAGASVIVPAKTFTFTKTAPTVSAGASVIVPSKTFTFTKTAPSVSAGASVIVPAKTFTFTKTAPTVVAGGPVTITVPAKTFTFTKTAPTVSASAAVAETPAGGGGILYRDRIVYKYRDRPEKSDEELEAERLKKTRQKMGILPPDPPEVAPEEPEKAASTPPSSPRTPPARPVLTLKPKVLDEDEIEALIERLDGEINLGKKRKVLAAILMMSI